MAKRERALVVGGTGQIGAQIIRCLGNDLCVCASRSSIGAGTVQVDLGGLSARDARRLIGVVKPTVVYCVGGMNDVERCETEPELAMRVNCDGPAQLARAAAENDIPFVHFSSDYIFDGESGPYREDDRPNPINVYGRSKWAGETAVCNSHPSPIIVRTTVVYGPDPGEKNFLYTLRRVLNACGTIRVATDQISTPSYNRDIALNTIALVNAGSSGIFHMCGFERLSRLEFAERAVCLMGINHREGIVGVPTQELGQKARRPLSAGLVSDKLKTVQGLSMRSIEDSIRDWMSE